MCGNARRTAGSVPAVFCAGMDPCYPFPYFTLAANSSAFGDSVPKYSLT